MKIGKGEGKGKERKGGNAHNTESRGHSESLASRLHEFSNAIDMIPFIHYSSAQSGIQAHWDAKGEPPEHPNETN